MTAREAVRTTTARANSERNQPVLVAAWTRRASSGRSTSDTGIRRRAIWLPRSLPTATHDTTLPGMVACSASPSSAIATAVLTAMLENGPIRYSASAPNRYPRAANHPSRLTTMPASWAIDRRPITAARPPRATRTEQTAVVTDIRPGLLPATAVVSRTTSSSRPRCHPNVYSAMVREATPSTTARSTNTARVDRIKNETPSRTISSAALNFIATNPEDPRRSTSLSSTQPARVAAPMATAAPAADRRMTFLASHRRAWRDSCSCTPGVSIAARPLAMVHSHCCE